jgi:prepilin-type N-terminal cleavage/methylation domain-containing protein
MKNGFTLIELLIVLAIVGILSSILYSSYQNYVSGGVNNDPSPSNSAVVPDRPTR